MPQVAHHGRHRWVSWCARGIAAAALFASACSAPPNRLPVPTDPLQGTSPAGAVASPITFRWTGNVPDGVVRVSIEDRAQRPVFSFPARGDDAVAPAGLAAVLTRGEPFTWTVSNVDENGETSRTSKPVEFTPE